MLAGALRLAMWIVLMLEGELHILLMLGAAIPHLHTCTSIVRTSLTASALTPPSSVRSPSPLSTRLAGDFLHTAFLADFVVIYFRSLASSGLGGFLTGSDVQLVSMEAAV